MSLNKEVKKNKIHVVGGGLAGCEAAWQLLQAGAGQVVLHEMRPKKMTPAHQTGDLAELVCSNSFKSENPDSAAGCLKFEMCKFSSLIMQAAYHASRSGLLLLIENYSLSFIYSKLHDFKNFSLQTEECKVTTSRARC